MGALPPLVRRHNQPATATAAPSPTAPRVNIRVRPDFDEPGSINSRYVSASGDVVVFAPTRRSGAGTHRDRYANASEPHLGHRWESWTSLQSRQSRATCSCMHPVYLPHQGGETPTRASSSAPSFANDANEATSLHLRRLVHGADAVEDLTLADRESARIRMYRRRIRAARETMEQLRGNTRRAYELRSRNPIDGLDEIVDRCVGGHVARRSRLGALQNVAAYLLERERQDLGLGRVGLKVFDQAEALVRCHI